MAEMKKLTKKDYFAMLKELVADRQDLVDFIDHEVELLNKKSSKNTQTKTQIANEKIKEKLVNILTVNNECMSISDIQSNDDEIASYSNQKISALLTQLVNDKIVERIIDKKKTYFKIASV